MMTGTRQTREVRSYGSNLDNVHCYDDTTHTIYLFIVKISTPSRIFQKKYYLDLFSRPPLLLNLLFVLFIPDFRRTSCPK